MTIPILSEKNKVGENSDRGPGFFFENIQEGFNHPSHRPTWSIYNIL